MCVACVPHSLCRGGISVLRSVGGLGCRTGSGSVSRADSGCHQRHLFALLQLILSQGRCRVWGHAALQPGHCGHCGQRQPGGHLPLVTGGKTATNVSFVRLAVWLVTQFTLIYYGELFRTRDGITYMTSFTLFFVLFFLRTQPSLFLLCPAFMYFWSVILILYSVLTLWNMAEWKNTFKTKLLSPIDQLLIWKCNTKCLINVPWVKSVIIRVKCVSSV